MTRWEELGLMAEEYVRSRWDFPIIVCDGSYRDFARGTVLINWANHRFYDFPGFDAAATFTAEREEAIRQKREEIGVVKAAQTVAEVEGCSVERITWARILAVLEGQLAEMLKGWKG